MPVNDEIYIYDCEVFAHDWLIGFKRKGQPERYRFWNDNDAVIEFMTRRPLLAGFNVKRYDQFILKAVLAGFTPEEVKAVNDFIIGGGNGYDYEPLRNARVYFDEYDLMDDTQQGTSLKSVEAHLGMDIRETTVPFDLPRPLTEAERAEVEFYNDHDIDATEKLDELRQPYLETKLALAAESGLDPRRALSKTNAQLTALYLHAQAPENPWTDERNYVVPKNLNLRYVPPEMLTFFDALHDRTIVDEDLFSRQLKLDIGGCEITIGFGGVHGALPCYRERSTEERCIVNVDVGSFYPHLITVNGYASRNMPNPQMYADMLGRRMQAKKSGDKVTANALKLVANTTYGATKRVGNALYDPLMARSICISGQLYLTELLCHICDEIASARPINVNTDGIMLSLARADLPTLQKIKIEWETRTGFELEEDHIREIIQKDVSNYIEIAEDGSRKIKGPALVRGIPAAGAFRANNNAPIIPRATIAYLVEGVPVEETISKSTDIFDFQLIAKASGLYSTVLREHNGELETVQKCNRVYASLDESYGRLYKTHGTTGATSLVPGMPENCLIDNANEATIEQVDKQWYITEALRLVNQFTGHTVNKKSVKAIEREALSLLEVDNEQLSIAW